MIFLVCISSNERLCRNLCFCLWIQTLFQHIWPKSSYFGNWTLKTANAKRGFSCRQTDKPWPGWRVERVWVQRSGVASAGVGERCTATTSMTSASATLSATLALTHILPIKEPVKLHCPPPVSNVTCPSHYQAPWSPTVSAHVIGPITRHACIFVLHFLSLLLPSCCCFNSQTLENKASDVQRQSKRGRDPWWTHTFSVFFPTNDKERRCAFESPCSGQQRFFCE